MGPSQFFLLYNNGGIVEQSKANFGVFVLLVLIGIGSIVRFSSDVRPVQVVGISGGGAACGAALFGFIFSMRSRKKA